MKYFSTDSDILKYEPILLTEYYLRSQVLALGDGAVLDGASLSKDGAGFETAGVEEGDVVFIKSESAGIEGAYTITSVVSDDEIKIVPAGAEDSEAGIGSANDVEYRIATFEPQIAEAYTALRQYFGITDDDWTAEQNDSLRQCSTYAVIASVYATMAGEQTVNDGFWRKSLHYQKMFVRARERSTVMVDKDGDGVAEESRSSSARVVRD